jgi:prefoldin subunit 5
MELNVLSALVSGLTGLFASTGLTYWVYRTLNKAFDKTVENLKEEIKKLKVEIHDLKNAEAKGYHKAHKLATILNKTLKCPHGGDCAVRAEYEKYMEEEGAI